MKLNLRLAALMVSAFSMVTACSKDVEEEQNDNEVITTLEIRLTDRANSQEVVYKFDDPDGFDAGSPTPIIDIVRLGANKIYDVELRLLNNTENPAENITEEVEEEADAHRFYLLPSPGSNIAVSNLDNDPNGVPVGVTSTWTTGAAATGTIRIVLRHYPDGGKASADPVDSPKSSTDVDTEFNTIVE